MTSLVIGYKWFIAQRAVATDEYLYRKNRKNGIVLTGGFSRAWVTETFEAICHNVALVETTKKPLTFLEKLRGVNQTVPEPETPQSLCERHLTAKTCTCGIYSYKTLDLLKARESPSRAKFTAMAVNTGRSHAIAEVFNYGTVQPWTEGWKASLCKISKLWCTTELYRDLLVSPYKCELRNINELFPEWEIERQQEEQYERAVAKMYSRTWQPKQFTLNSDITFLPPGSS